MALLHSEPQNHDAVIKYKIKVAGSSDVTSADIHLGEGKNGEAVVDLLKDSKKNGIREGTSIRGNITSSDLKGSLKGKELVDLILSMKSELHMSISIRHTMRMER